MGFSSLTKKSVSYNNLLGAGVQYMSRAATSIQNREFETSKMSVFSSQVVITHNFLGISDAKALIIWLSLEMAGEEEWTSAACKNCPRSLGGKTASVSAAGVCTLVIRGLVPGANKFGW